MGVGCANMAQDCIIHLTVGLYGDATAASGTAHRCVVGQVRHIEHLPRESRSYGLLEAHFVPFTADSISTMLLAPAGTSPGAQHQWAGAQQTQLSLAQPAQRELSEKELRG